MIPLEVCRHVSPYGHTYIIQQPILPFDLDSLIAFSPALMWHEFWFAAPLFPSQRTTGGRRHGVPEVTICFWL
jgi:hypothetical protein